MMDVAGKGNVGVDEFFEVCFGGGLSHWMLESDEILCYGQFCCFLTFSSFLKFQT